MKNKLFIPAIIAGFFFITACEKEHEDIVNTKVINVDMNENTTYRYTIPAAGEQAMEISQQAQHALSNEIKADALHNLIFEYTPALNYAGIDEVHVSTIEDKHHDGNHNGQHHGNCQNQENDSETNYVFKINILDTTGPKSH